MCTGAFLHIIAPGCTLASSPAFAEALEEATISAADWVAECRTYKDGLDKELHWGASRRDFSQPGKYHKI